MTDVRFRFEKDEKAEDDLPRNLKHGPVVRVPMHLMDSVQREVAAHSPKPIRDALGRVAGHRPGSILTDEQRAERAEAYRQYDNALTSAWRRGASPMPTGGIPTQTGDALKDAYSAYRHRLTNAWRSR